MQPDSMSSSDEAQTGDADSSVGSSYAERRKSSKPIMEKRRRARINSSLNELKSILLEALKKDSTRHSKLEKADILEMTVKYLKNVERQRLSVNLSIDPTIVDKYRAGFSECRNEVMKFLSTCEGVTVDVRTRLLSHLGSCLQSIQSQSNLFDESGLGLEVPSFPSPILQNGHNQQIRVRFPEPNVPISNSSNNANIAPKPPPASTPTSEPQIAVLHSTPPRRYAPSLVLAEGTQLTSAIGGLDSGNIAVLVPQIGGGTTTAFLTTLSGTPHFVETVPMSTGKTGEANKGDRDGNKLGKNTIFGTKKSPNHREILPKGMEKGPSPNKHCSTDFCLSHVETKNMVQHSEKSLNNSNVYTPANHACAHSETIRLSAEPPKKRRRTQSKTEFTKTEKRKSNEDCDPGFAETMKSHHSPPASTTSSASREMDGDCSDSSVGTPHRVGCNPIGGRGPWRPWSKPRIAGEDT
uniref:E(Spl)/hairy-c n=1 Tax=Phallusia mammillata TaxID=59560 RepID=A0A6F9DF39_9ASCI|nr:E(spl)/hairy-c [Phallusia mammillata]